MADKILTEDDVRQIARDEANYAIGKHREQYHEANGLGDPEVIGAFVESFEVFMREHQSGVQTLRDAARQAMRELQTAREMVAAGGGFRCELPASRAWTSGELAVTHALRSVKP